MYKLTSGLRRSLSSALIGRRNQHQKATQTIGEEFQEINIPVPWGHIAGKWWGRTDVKPLLGLHGWQDNAGTWDRIAPMLPAHISLLAIDCPGHGLSSRFPPGLPYRITDHIFVMRRIIHHFGWDKISILAHSMGGVQSFVYASVYPDKVENLISIDAFKPLSVNPDVELDKLGHDIDKFLETDSRKEVKPSYSYTEIVQKLYHGMLADSLTEESCKILLKRGIQKSGDGYYFTRDPRVKIGRLSGWLHETVLSLAANITCNVLFIKAIPGFVYESPDIANETLDVVRKSARRYEYHIVEGQHHVHLNNPERVAPIIINFLNTTLKEP
ncbi:probable serine hydrolase isoform X2 [Anabrus simplex]|uniref:probable serine hydrolase isoform X2 n=1 Tax=Anabrus simplex TaxID=316456 RepID=UPI0035A2B87E